MSIKIDNENESVIINGRPYEYTPELPDIAWLEEVIDELKGFEKTIEVYGENSDKTMELEGSIRAVCEEFYSFSGTVSSLEGKAVLEERYERFWDHLAEIKRRLEKLNDIFMTFGDILRMFDEVDRYSDAYDDGLFWVSDEVSEDFGYKIKTRKIINWEPHVHMDMSSDLHGKEVYQFATISEETYQKGGKYKLKYVK